ncbi:Uncharacterised protein [Enterobacter roggenkampii]|nr:Uncharacterised protein [Enterobacter roggenkampii]
MIRAEPVGVVQGRTDRNLAAVPAPCAVQSHRSAPQRAGGKAVLTVFFQPAAVNGDRCAHRANHRKGEEGISQLVAPVAAVVPGQVLLFKTAYGAFAAERQALGAVQPVGRPLAVGAGQPPGVTGDWTLEAGVQAPFTEFRARHIPGLIFVGFGIEPRHAVAPGRVEGRHAAQHFLRVRNAQNQAGEVARAALKRRVVEPVAAGSLNHACRNAGFHLPVAEDHPGRVKAVGSGIARGEPVESLVTDGGPVVTPGVAVVQ